MPDIVISEFMDEATVAELARDYDVLYEPELVERPADLKAALPGARALIVRNRTQVTDDLLAAGDSLQVIGRLGVGLDNIDLAACEARGIPVCPATGTNAVSVAEYVIAGILILRRGAYHASDRVLAGDWPRTELMGREAAGARLGLVGFGGIAREVAKRALALDMRIAAFDPFVADDDPIWQESGVSPQASSEPSVIGWSGGGCVGKGWVGESQRPKSSLCGTARSSTGKTGSPVSRCRTKSRPIFVAWATASTVRPSRSTCTRFGGAARS